MQNKLIVQLHNSLKETCSYPDTLESGCHTLNKSRELKKFLESLFGKGSILAAYDRDSGFGEGEWDMAGCDSVFITKTGKVVGVSNSEWGRMSVVGRLKGEDYD